MTFSLETHTADADLFRCEVNEERISGFIETVVRPVIGRGESVQLEDVFDEEKLDGIRRVWALDEVEDSETFDQMDEGDVVLFTHSDAVVGVAVITAIAESEELGDQLWGESSFNKLFLLRELIPVSLSVSDLYEELGSGGGVPSPETHRIDDEAKETLLESYEDFSKFVETISTAAEPSLDSLLGRSYDDPPTCVWLDQTEFESTTPDEIDLAQGCIYCQESSEGGEQLTLLGEGDVIVHHSEREFIGYSVVTAAHSISIDGVDGVWLWYAYSPFEESYRRQDYAGLLLNSNVDLRSVPLAYQIKQGRVHFTPWESVRVLLEDLVENPAEQFLESRYDRTISRMGFDLSNEPLYYPGEEESLQQQINSTLAAGKHIIFTGPPGTGKTRLARAVCEHATNTALAETVDDYQFTTASADWTSFDTVGGYSPSKTEEGLEFQPGQFLKCFRDGEDLRNRWLLIDELNRADIDKAMGGLFSVLTGEEVELPYENREPIRVTPLSAEDDTHFGRSLTEIAESIDTYPVLPSWRLIATINTSDKASLYELSYAFTRRFNFIHVGVPDLKDNGQFVTKHLDPTTDESYAIALGSKETRMLASENIQKELSVLWGRINKHRTLGPSIILDILQYIYESIENDLGDLPELSAEESSEAESEEDTESGSENGDDTEEEGDSGSRIRPELYQGPLTDAITMLVFPQLEGLREDNLEELILKLDDSAETVDDDNVTVHLETKRLHRKAEDFYGITIDE
jgi:MoxR-like ATPase